MFDFCNTRSFGFEDTHKYFVSNHGLKYVFINSPVAIGTYEDARSLVLRKRLSIYKTRIE